MMIMNNRKKSQHIIWDFVRWDLFCTPWWWWWRWWWRRCLVMSVKSAETRKTESATESAINSWSRKTFLSGLAIMRFVCDQQLNTKAKIVWGFFVIIFFNNFYDQQLRKNEDVQCEDFWSKCKRIAVSRIWRIVEINSRGVRIILRGKISILWMGPFK